MSYMSKKLYIIGHHIDLHDISIGCQISFITLYESYQNNNILRGNNCINTELHVKKALHHWPQD